MKLKNLIASVLAVASIFATVGMTGCFGSGESYVAKAIASDSNEQYGFAIGKNSTNKEAILAAMNKVIDEMENADDVITYYTELSEEKTPSVTLQFPNLADNTAGTLKVYTNAEFAPFEFKDDAQNVVGVDIYYMNLVAEELNMKLEVSDIAFDAIVGKIALEDNAVGAAGMTIDSERAEQVDFSNPYYSTVQCIISKEGEAFDTLESLKGKKIGVQKGTTGYQVIDEAINSGILKDTGAEVVQYDSGPVAFTALKAGKCDVVVIDELPAKQLVK